MGQMDKAKKVLQKVLETDPKHTGAHMQLAIITAMVPIHTRVLSCDLIILAEQQHSWCYFTDPGGCGHRPQAANGAPNYCVIVRESSHCSITSGRATTSWAALRSRSETTRQR